MAGMPLLSGRDYMRGPGVDSSGPAIQLPATAPIGPTAAVQGVANSPAMQVPAVAGMGEAPIPVASGGLAAGLTPGGLGRAMFGDTAINAAQQANQQVDQGNFAQGLGSGLRAAGAAVVHPYLAAADAVGTIGHAAAGVVNNFASGLLGTTPAAAMPMQVARPATASAAPPASPASTGLELLPSPRAGVIATRTPNPSGNGYSVNYSLAPEAAAPVASAAAPAPARQATEWERVAGVAPGAQMATLAAAKPSERLGMLQTMQSMVQNARGTQAREQALGLIHSNFQDAMARAGTDKNAQAAAKADVLRNLLAISSPQAFAAGYIPGSLQSATQ